MRLFHCFVARMLCCRIASMPYWHRCKTCLAMIGAKFTVGEAHIVGPYVNHRIAQVI